MRFPAVLAVAALLSFSTAAASADTLLFSLTDGTNHISFTSPSVPVANPAYSYSFYINADVTINGVSAPEGVEFFTQDFGGGFSIFSETDGTDIVNQYDPVNSTQFFTGTVMNPTFFTGGPYALVSYNASDTPTFNSNFVLNITSVAPSATVTPEPSSIALLGTGLLGITGLVRKRFVR